MSQLPPNNFTDSIEEKDKEGVKEVEEEVEPSLEGVYESEYAKAQKVRSSMDKGIFGLTVTSLHTFQQAYNFKAKECLAMLTPRDLDCDSKYKHCDLNSKELDLAANKVRYELDRFPKTRFSKYTQGTYLRKTYEVRNTNQENFCIPDSVEYKFQPHTSQSELLSATLDFIKYCTDRPFCPPIPSAETREILAQEIEGHRQSWRIQGFPYNPYKDYTAVPNTTVLVKTRALKTALGESDHTQSALQSPAAALDEVDDQEDSDSDNSAPP